MIRTLFFLVFLFLVPLQAQVEIVCPNMPLVDEEFSLQITGLFPKQVVLIETTWIDIERVEWGSECVFQADANGVVDLGRQEPISGSYEGADPMGIFWSMQMRNVIPLGADRKFTCKKIYTLPHVVRVYDGKHMVAEKLICRAFRKGEVQEIEVNGDPFRGVLFMPKVHQKSPLIITLTGSNGGIERGIASLFASHGLPSLALAYSGIDDLPETVENVPMEYFESVFEWVESHPDFSGEIYLHGISRGGELALLLGSLYPSKIHKIVALAASSVVLSKDSWIQNGKPVLPPAPFIVDLNNDGIETENLSREHPKEIRLFRERGLTFEKARYDLARIPVENIRCPILLISGGDDQLMPASIYSKQIMQRLDDRSSPIAKRHLDFPKAGHLISIPYFRRLNLSCYKGTWLSYGGNPQADEEASRTSWSETLRFFFGEEVTIARDGHTD